MAPLDIRFLSNEQFLIFTMLAQLAVVAAAGDDVRAVPQLPAAAADREARLAGAAGLRRGARHPAVRRRRLPHPPRLQRGRPDPGRPVPGRPARRALHRRPGRPRRRPAGRPRRRVRRRPVRGRLRLRRRRAARDLPEGRHLALLAVRLHRPPPLRLAAAAALPDRLADHPDHAADPARAAAAGDRPPLARAASSCSWPTTR